MQFNCPHCQQSLEAEEDTAGDIVACPSCNKELPVPGDKPPARLPVFKKQKVSPNSYKQSRPSTPVTVQNGNKRIPIKFILIPVALIILLVISVVCVCYKIKATNDNNAKIVQQRQDKLKFILSDISYEELQGIYCRQSTGIAGLDYSDLQKSELWATKYKNKRIKWTGKVLGIDDKLEVQITKHPYSTTICDITLHLASSERAKAIKLLPGSWVTFCGILDYYGSMETPFNLVDGSIVSSSER